MPHPHLQGWRFPGQPSHRLTQARRRSGSSQNQGYPLHPNRGFPRDSTKTTPLSKIFREVFSPLTTSTNPISGTGPKKCSQAPLRRLVYSSKAGDGDGRSIRRQRGLRPGNSVQLLKNPRFNSSSSRAASMIQSTSEALDRFFSGEIRSGLL